MSSNIQALIAAIPTAEDGDVVTRKYHNSLRDALETIAGLLVSTAPTGGERTVITLAPSLLPAEPQPPWALGQGFASRAAGGTCEGWIPLSLPDGGRIQKMTLLGGRIGAPTPPLTFTFQVQLLRQPITETTTTTLITIPGLTSAANDKDPFEATGVFQVAGVTTPAAIAEFQTVDNRSFKYLVKAKLVGATPEMIVKIYAVRVEYDEGVSAPPHLAIL